MSERDALLERAQVDFYDEPMKAALEKYYELDLSNERTAKEYKREMQEQGYPIRGPNRGQEQEIGPSR